MCFSWQNPDLHGWEIQKNSTQVIMGLVNLMLTPTLPAEIRNEAAEVSFLQSYISKSGYLI